MPELSVIETLFTEAAARLWPPGPKLRAQHPITAGGRTVRADFAVPELKLVIELESWQWHSALGPEKVTRDKQRERLLEQGGWRVISFTGTEVKQDAARCVRETLKIAGLSPVTAQGRRDRGDWPEILDYEELLWQCRKLCLRALTLDESSPAHGIGAPLIILDAFGFWDSYANRYDYTNCVQAKVQRCTFPDPDCEHQETRVACCTDYEKGSIHYFTADGPAEVHQWHECETCGIRFPRAGHEQEWLDCGTCGR